MAQTAAASGRARHSLGTDAPMGRVGTDAPAVLDGVFTGSERGSPLGRLSPRARGLVSAVHAVEGWVISLSV
jgi:hypothetical protein